ncbi:unnamed protein product, partial [Rangifer tarandus platyrhynchus]
GLRSVQAPPPLEQQTTDNALPSPQCDEEQETAAAPLFFHQLAPHQQQQHLRQHNDCGRIVTTRSLRSFSRSRSLEDATAPLSHQLAPQQQQRRRKHDDCGRVTRPRFLRSTSRSCSLDFSTLCPPSRRFRQYRRLSSPAGIRSFSQYRRFSTPAGMCNLSQYGRLTIPAGMRLLAPAAAAAGGGVNVRLLLLPCERAEQPQRLLMLPGRRQGLLRAQPPKAYTYTHGVYTYIREQVVVQRHYEQQQRQQGGEEPAREWAQLQALLEMEDPQLRIIYLLMRFLCQHIRRRQVHQRSRKQPRPSPRFPRAAADESASVCFAALPPTVEGRLLVDALPHLACAASARAAAAPEATNSFAALPTAVADDSASTGFAARPPPAPGGSKRTRSAGLPTTVADGSASACFAALPPTAADGLPHRSLQMLPNSSVRSTWSSSARACFVALPTAQPLPTIPRVP